MSQNLGKSVKLWTEGILKKYDRLRQFGVKVIFSAQYKNDKSIKYEFEKNFIEFFNKSNISRFRPDNFKLIIKRKAKKKTKKEVKRKANRKIVLACELITSEDKGLVSEVFNVVLSLQIDMTIEKSRKIVLRLL